MVRWRKSLLHPIQPEVWQDAIRHNPPVLSQYRTMSLDGVAVGMSGGVDSSTAAWALNEQGYRVVGVTLRFFCYERSYLPKRSCCSETSLRRAKEVCERLGIDHHTLNVELDFRRYVIRNFIEEYRKGRTPNPCVICNEKVKFPALGRIADWLGLEHIATGHYVRLVERPARRIFLATAFDRAKDQSYFLYRVPVKLLARTVFPIGEMEKGVVSRISKELGFSERVQQESQDVCFLPGGDLHAFLSAHVKNRRGEVVDQEGHILGYHRGVSFYTIGQRRGLGIVGKVPLYVKSIDARRNRVVLAPESELYSTVAWCRGIKLRGHAPHHSLLAKVRYRHRPAEVKSIERRDNRLLVRFKDQQRAITPGQSLVLYRGGMVVGGGIIEKAGNGEGE